MDRQLDSSFCMDHNIALFEKDLQTFVMSFLEMIHFITLKWTIINIQQFSSKNVGFSLQFYKMAADQLESLETWQFQMVSFNFLNKSQFDDHESLWNYIL
ncbi:Hypothetical_protein [Hexamita inflata]|uniref:Hypothetical_protein n=1 Tax=Hexamita inflata TaxID=28002 RepID=A0ABP1H6D1_9EUKA